jgi:hypothetical protein
MKAQLIENSPTANAQASLFDTQCSGSSLSNQAKDVVMGEKFGYDKNQGDNGEGNMHSLSPKAPARNWLLPPLRRRPFAE